MPAISEYTELSFYSPTGNLYYYNDETGFIVPQAIHTSSTQRQILDAARPTVAGVKHFLFNLKAGFKELILEMSRSCNLRCKYCCYSDHYPFHRSHASGMMDFATAQKAVDLYFEYFFEIAWQNPFINPTIAFYGGEPLLNFDLIQKTVEYIYQKYKLLKPIDFTITTNATLLSDEMISFFIDNGFSIIISLDGHKENHDRNRRTINDEPTFDQVFARVRHIQHYYPEYKKFGISGCYDGKTDLFQAHQFVQENDLFVVNFSEVDSVNSTYHDQFSHEDQKRFYAQYQALKKEYQRKVVRDAIGKADKGLLLPLFSALYLQSACHTLGSMQRISFMPYGGSCVPGQKIYATADGQLHMCEKTNPHMPVGNVEDGLDFVLIAKRIEEFNAELGKCVRCPITKLCSLCMAKANAGGTFSIPDGFCEREAASARQVLSDYVAIMEQNPASFHSFIIPYFKELAERSGKRLD